MNTEIISEIMKEVFQFVTSSQIAYHKLDYIPVYKYRSVLLS